MELGPIFRALMYNKSRFWLITLEVALTLAIVANCVNMLLDTRREFLRNTGLDEDNLLVVETYPFDPEFQEDGFVDAMREEDLLQLRSFPGVADAVSIAQIPLSGGGSSNHLFTLESPPESDGHGTPYFQVGDHAISTLGIELSAGRDFLPEDFPPSDPDERTMTDRPIILSDALATAFFGDENPVGRRLRNDNGEITYAVVGTIRKMHNSWPRSEWGGKGEHVMLYAASPGSPRRMRYMVRTEPGALESVFTGVEELMRETHAGRIVGVESLGEHKLDYYQDALVMIKMLTSVIVLLILVTSLGIVGLTSFSVTQRTRQIGTRRALGATKGDIVRYFLIENWMITGIGVALGIGLTYALNYALVSAADVSKIEWTFLAGGALALWITGVLAAVAPALRASGVAPEIATRSV